MEEKRDCQKLYQRWLTQYVYIQHINSI